VLLGPAQGLGTLKDPLQTLIQGREPEVVFAVLSNFLVLAQRYPMLFSQVGGKWQLHPVACWFGGDGSCLLLGCFMCVRCLAWLCHAMARIGNGQPWRREQEYAACAGMQSPCM